MKEPKLTMDEVNEVLAASRWPRVTEAGIKDKIASVTYFRDDMLTIAVITMGNGFKFVGTSAPASPENFDAEVGERYAFNNAFKQIWTHEGYLLRDRLYIEGQMSNG